MSYVNIRWNYIEIISKWSVNGDSNFFHALLEVILPRIFLKIFK